MAGPAPPENTQPWLQKMLEKVGDGVRLPIKVAAVKYSSGGHTTRVTTIVANFKKPGNFARDLWWWAFLWHMPEIVPKPPPPRYFFRLFALN